MNGAKLGTVTIGQSPRPDVTPILDAYVPAGVPRLHMGVLDGLGDDDIAARFSPRPRERRLLTRLAAGRSLELDAEAVEQELQARVRHLEQAGCTVIVTLCTGLSRSPRTTRAWLIEPDRLLPPLVTKMIGARRLGVMVPLDSQVQTERRKWDGMQVPAVVAVANPYEDGEDSVTAAASELMRSGANVLLLDDIGCTARHQRAARAATGLPVLLSTVLVARVAGGCFAEP